MTCNGYTATLTLVRDADQRDPSAPPYVQGVNWLVTLSGSLTDLPRWPAEDQVVVSVESFTWRGDQGDRLDLWVSRSAGLGDQLSYKGLVRLTDGFGGFQDNDFGRVHLWIKTPAGILGANIPFRLRALPDRLEIAEILSSPPGSCPG
jgi:hypothetical protein